MQRRDLARYHDVAASTKARGEGIGFAGVGIKLGLLVAAKWSPKPDAAPHTWRRVAAGLAVSCAVEVDSAAGPHRRARHGRAASPPNPLSPLLDAGYLEEALRRHFEPLLEPAFDDLLRRHYAAAFHSR